MKIGVPKEIKNHEYRVGLTPAGVRELTSRGHAVLVETMAGHAIGFDDSEYRAAGAQIAGDAGGVYAVADMIVKVKEPQAPECAMLREGQVIFCYLHLAPDPAQAEALQKSGAVAIAFETVTAADGGLPLLAPMSEVAGRLAVQAGAHALEKAQGGRGVLLSGVAGVPSAKVTIIGGGVVGTNAALLAHGLGAQVFILDSSLKRLRELDHLFKSQVQTIYSTAETIEREVLSADLVIGAVLIPGASAPKLVSHEMVKRMQRGAVLVDVAIDQGGCFETSRATTHAEPTYVVDEVVHYCVANMPGAVARTSTQSLENATLPYTLRLADHGWKDALEHDPHFRHGLNVAFGKITHPAVAEALGKPYTDPAQFLI